MAKAKGGYGIADSIEATPKKTRQGRRSEEHTSELQSH